MQIINLENIKKSYLGGSNVVNIDKLTIERGDFVAITGKSGAGKSTLLNIIGFLMLPTSGTYYHKGKKVNYKKNAELCEKRNKDVGFVVQNFALLNDYTVFENIQLPLDIANDKKNRKDRIRSVLKIVGLSGKENRLPAELSGGEQQRVAIARALIMEPTLILADEPTGALDSSTGQEVWDILLELNSLHGVTVIVVTHESYFSEQSKRIIVMNDGEIIDDSSK